MCINTTYIGEVNSIMAFIINSFRVSAILYVTDNYCWTTAYLKCQRLW